MNVTWVPTADTPMPLTSMTRSRLRPIPGRLLRAPDSTAGVTDRNRTFPHPARIRLDSPAEDLLWTNANDLGAVVAPARSLFDERIGMATDLDAAHLPRLYRLDVVDD